MYIHMSRKKQTSADNRKKIAELEEQVKKTTDNWKRALADYQNLEKRTVEERGQIVKFAAENLILKLLSVLDNFEMVLNHSEDKGLKLAVEEFNKVLAEEDVVRVEVRGKKFNPETMECIELVSGEKNVVIEEIRPGYKMYNKIIRPVQVKVGKG